MAKGAQEAAVDGGPGGRVAVNERNLGDFSQSGPIRARAARNGLLDT
jgi:hypothetical protein